MNTRCGRNTYYMSLGGQNFVELIVREFILGEAIEYREAYDPFVYSCVPRYVLDRSMKNRARLQQALEVLRRTPEPYPLHYAPDSFLHNFWARELLPIACLLALPNLLLMLASWKAEALFAKGLVHGIDSPRNLRTLFLVLGMVDTVIYLGIMLSFGRGVLAG